ncbi:3-hydroxyacyl-[acyl-carrier-protein] dehydratase FabZ [candidate division KSB3 bacterium]|uniref:3-hydroxyacyl-[acyl-carrier-protein] dehydratase FabZ n=1 Tax=candidate division KSB3 bacterium TaxID=2044937 RepID=A0A2G6E4T8_9BACT|nr:MAG: 3-hydroxyacyl-[acyl-carrier-protein] dehydratase FabZ [candidate division KSB3 bacterium]PIE29318.1 MAG: 3-hydroxyacyl-[acyl-carrier-protein] dehydratase FabZ [candidate division KSB3 bacterium]
MELTIQDIQKFLPHRYPFLLVDRILESGEDYIIGIKNVTINEPFFQGHFPGIPVMPGVLIIEAMAQVSGIFFFNTFGGEQDRITYFAGLDNTKFRKPVTPGDQLRMEIRINRIRKTSVKVHGTAYVEQDIAAEADLLLIMEMIERSETL